MLSRVTHASKALPYRIKIDRNTEAIRQKNDGMKECRFDRLDLRELGQRTFRVHGHSDIPP